MPEVATKASIRSINRYLNASRTPTRPGGIETISAAFRATRRLEEVVERPASQGSRTDTAGRVLTLRAYRHMGLTGPSRMSSPQIGLFEAQDDDDTAASGGG